MSVVQADTKILLNEHDFFIGLFFYNKSKNTASTPNLFQNSAVTNKDNLNLDSRAKVITREKVTAVQK